LVLGERWVPRVHERLRLLVLCQGGPGERKGVRLMLTFAFGKTKVRVEVEGCVSCGTRWSWRWGSEREVAVQVGGQRSSVSLPKCGDCLALGEQQARLDSLLQEAVHEG
jgi:hypothetical protein